MGLYFWNILWRGTGESIGKCTDLVLTTVCVCANVQPHTAIVAILSVVHHYTLRCSLFTRVCCCCCLHSCSHACVVCVLSTTCVHISVPSKVVRFQSSAWVEISLPNIQASPQNTQLQYKNFVDKVLTWLPVLLTLINYHVAISLIVLHIIHTIADKMST